MHVTVVKVQDGDRFITKDSFGDLFDGDVVVDDPAVQVSEDATVALVTQERYGVEYVVGLFSWVDYKDTSSTEPLVDGVRHTGEWVVPGGSGFGPYSVLAHPLG